MANGWKPRGIRIITVIGMLPVFSKNACQGMKSFAGKGFRLRALKCNAQAAYRGIYKRWRINKINFFVLHN